MSGPTPATPDAALPLIEARGISKRFALRRAAARRYGIEDFLRVAIGRRRRTDLRPGEFWALNDISFSVSPGESLAVLGRNGAGKSTLLMLMTGRMLPDAGELTVRGRLGVLALGSFGFQTTMTGMENIFLKGVALGLSRRELEPLVPEIVAFAELGEFIEAPMRTYSSGMVARLGFAIAINVKPDILLADEALSAGDASFVEKCRLRISEMRRRMTFVIVTHSASTAQQLCQQGLVLERGRVAFYGSAAEAADFYTRRGVSATPPVSSPWGVRHDAG